MSEDKEDAAARRDERRDKSKPGDRHLRKAAGKKTVVVTLIRLEHVTEEWYKKENPETLIHNIRCVALPFDFWYPETSILGKYADVKDAEKAIRAWEKRPGRYSLGKQHYRAEIQQKGQEQ